MKKMNFHSHSFSQTPLHDCAAVISFGVLFVCLSAALCELWWKLKAVSSRSMQSTGAAPWYVA
jgi:hypothetical protein